LKINQILDDFQPAPAAHLKVKEYLKGTNLVLISPDAASVFPDEDSVNNALRSLITLARRSAESPKQSSRRIKARS
jgi:hypothetical protein